MVTQRNQLAGQLSAILRKMYGIAEGAVFPEGQPPAPALAGRRPVPQLHEVAAQRHRQVDEARVIAAHEAQARVDARGQAEASQQALAPLAAGQAAAGPQAPQRAGDALDVLETEQPPTHIDDVDRDAETEGLIARRGELRNELRDINDKLRGLDEFARVGTEYSAELNEHRVRLASIGLIPEATDAEATCPVCQTILTETGAHDAIGQTLGRVARRIELAQRDQPRITQTRADFLQVRSQVRAGLADIPLCQP